MFEHISKPIARVIPREWREYVAAAEMLATARQTYVEAWRAFVKHEPAYCFDDEAEELIELMSAEMVFIRPENRGEEDHV